MNIQDLLLLAVRLSGAGLLILVLASPAIPRLLRWRDHVAVLPPLTRQVFWTYSTYTWMTNAWFALLALWLPHELLSRTALAAAVTAFIAVYWTGRIGIQFFYFDRSSAPATWFTRIAEAALVLLFLFLSFTFAAATAHNLRFA